MSFKEIATELVRSALDGLMEFLVLRGVDEFAREGGDIDVLVPRNCSKLALSLVGQRAYETGWMIAGIGDIGYLTQICLIKRSADRSHYHSIKVDFFNGVSWAALGDDPLGRALLAKRNQNGERLAVALTTLLQKLLYAGYLRDRDRDRIASACVSSQIEEFVATTRLPLSRADLLRGRLRKMARWRLRFASAGVPLVCLPSWIARVVLHKLYFAVFRSSIQGALIVVSNGDRSRWTALATQFRSLVERSGFAGPFISVQSNTRDQPVSLWLHTALLRWRAFRGETVIAIDDNYPSSLRQVTIHDAAVIHVHSPNSGSDVGDDFDILLTSFSGNALNTLRTIKAP